MTSSRFDQFIPFVKAAETVYKKGHYGDDNFVVVERDPKDPGGTTKWGLDARTHGEGVAKLSWDQARQIYFAWYWSGQTGRAKWDSCEQMPAPLGEVIFDTRINCGMGTASRFLKATTDPAMILKLRDNRYRYIARKNPDMERYLQGWLNRDNDLRSTLKI